VSRYHDEKVGGRRSTVSGGTHNRGRISGSALQCSVACCRHQAGYESRSWPAASIGHVDASPGTMVVDAKRSANSSEQNVDPRAYWSAFLRTFRGRRGLLEVGIQRLALDGPPRWTQSDAWAGRVWMRRACCAEIMEDTFVCGACKRDGARWGGLCERRNLASYRGSRRSSWTH